MHKAMNAPKVLEKPSNKDKRYILVLGHVAAHDKKRLADQLIQSSRFHSQNQRPTQNKSQLSAEEYLLEFEDCEALEQLEADWAEQCHLIWVGVDFQFANWAESLLSKRRCLMLGVGTQELLDVCLSATASNALLKKAISKALNYFDSQQEIAQLKKTVTLITQERKELSAIGVALSAEKDLDRLLSMVLEEGRKLGQCEGASLYLLVNDEAREPELIFKLTQNSVIEFEFKESRFPLTNDSLAGYVARTGETLNISDAHQIDPSAPYKFDDRFDVLTNYRCRELLVLPMKNHKGKIIGVLQFINRMSEAKNNETGEGFSDDTCDLLAGLASQAAVAIDNSQLIDNIHQLFEGFVSASVKAIESRDPVTSGHSFRVAELTTGLAEMLTSESSGRFADFYCSSTELREIRYASLLHDFGKVGVKENVLLKSNKLSDHRLHYLLVKIEWQKQYLQNQFYRWLAEQLQNSKRSTASRITEKEKELMVRLAELNNFSKILQQSNIPTVLEAEIAEELEKMARYQLSSDYPFQPDLLSQDDFLSLSVKKGSLTETERQEIQSHVVHTREFLSQIPWTDELAAIPDIAGAHHEKLDGTGYPIGLKDDQIPGPSKMMTIADIFDALTASDRPYKRAMPVTIALDILCDEAKRGKVDSEMLDVFIQSRVYRRVLEDSSN